MRRWIPQVLFIGKTTGLSFYSRLQKCAVAVDWKINWKLSRRELTRVQWEKNSNSIEIQEISILSASFFFFLSVNLSGLSICVAFGPVSQTIWIENIIYYSELQTDSIHSNLFLVHLATLLFKRPPKQPDKLIICSAMFYCCYLREKEKIFLVYPLRTGVMRRRRLITLPNPLPLCVHGPLRVYTHSWSWNK